VVVRTINFESKPFFLPRQRAHAAGVLERQCLPSSSVLPQTTGAPFKVFANGKTVLARIFSLAVGALTIYSNDCWVKRSTFNNVESP
jgi:hypothetical protein